jgi:hypothetical protein
MEAYDRKSWTCVGSITLNSSLNEGPSFCDCILRSMTRAYLMSALYCIFVQSSKAMHPESTKATTLHIYALVQREEQELAEESLRLPQWTSRLSYLLTSLSSLGDLIIHERWST